MRYIVATLVAALLAFAGLALGGAGHGWVAGAFGCFALAPVSFLAVANGLSRTPSFQGAIAILIALLLLCLVVAVATALEGVEYLLRFIHINGVSGLLVAGFAYVGSLAIAALAAVHARRVPRHGT